MRNLPDDIPHPNFLPPPPESMGVKPDDNNNYSGTIFTLTIILIISGAVFYFLQHSKSKTRTKPNKITTIHKKAVHHVVKKNSNETIIEIAPSIIPENSEIPESERVYTINKGKFEIKREEDAKKLGYSIIDLSDNFVPFIFSDGDNKPNSYKQTYINVANDITNEEGEKLSKDEHNYVELFGIMPSLSVLDKRFRSDASKTCYKKLNYSFFRKSRIHVIYDSKRDLGKEVSELKKQIIKAKRKTGVSSLKALRKRKKYSYLVRRYNLLNSKLYMVSQAQKRLKCEGFIKSYRPGYISYNIIKAIKRFEHKHMIFGWGILTGTTRKGFGRTPLENNFRTFKRILKSRIALSLGIFEDGSVNNIKGLNDRYVGNDKKKHKIRNLLKEYTNIVLKELNTETSQDTIDFFQAVDPKMFKNFRLAVKLPELPEYYNDNMKFSVEIDRGDVWYDAPYDATGKKRYHPIMRRPRIYLFTEYNNQKIPLVRWGTTVGGWRTEFKNGKEYLAYKGSDVGPRIWKDIYAGPVWIPPASTPLRGLVKSYHKKGRWITRINREEIGPSYASAYGLVAAYHIRNKSDSGRAIWFDNGIRTHGSVDYMSIMRRHSHGCHRLHNHLAVRLFSSILMRHNFSRIGQTKLVYNRKFEYKNKSYAINLKTRGYRFSLNQPISVMVKRGRILGKLKSPYKGLVRKPGIEYDKNDPNLMEPQDNAVKENVNESPDKNSVKPAKPTKPTKPTIKPLIKRKPAQFKNVKNLKRANSKNFLPPPPSGVKPL